MLGLVCGIISYPSAVKFIPPLFDVLKNLKVNKGLDLQGGIHLEYQADTSQIASDKADDALSAVQAVIERRVNAFGVGEPLVQISRAGNERRVIVELPGVKDIEQAKKMIKETPFLEFREPVADDSEILKYAATGLTGKNLKDANVTFQGQGIGSPQISLIFDDEGTKLFAEITKRNVGKGVAIVLDGLPITDTNGDGQIDQLDPPYAPTIQQEILGGQAVITGNYTVQEANALVKRLNEGALPVPITLVGQQSVDASLGDAALQKSLFAGLIGLGAVALFMILYYRLLGVIAVFALLLYTAMLLAIFKLSVSTPFAITVTLSGIAGFILSIGIAVDANVLIFERTREELSYGKNVYKSLGEGFRRAWPSIRDGHISTLITTFILIGLGTGFVKGFAIILALGVLLSLFTAVVLVRITTMFIIGEWAEKYPQWLVSHKKISE